MTGKLFQHVFGRDEQKSCRQYRYVCYESLCHTVSSTIRRKLGNCRAIHVFRGVLGRVQKPECLPQQVLGAERFAQSMPAVPVLPILLGLLQNRVLVKVLSCAENEGWSFCHGIITHYTQWFWKMLDPDPLVTQVAHAGAGNSECTLWCSGRVVHALGGFPGFKKWLTSWLVGRVLAGLNRLSKTKNSHPRLQTSGWKCPWKCNRRVGKGLVFNPTSHSFVSFQHGPS